MICDTIIRIKAHSRRHPGAGKEPGKERCVEEPTTFGRWLKRRRKALDLTQAALAHRIGYAPVTIQKIESDDLRPSRLIAEKLAEALEIPADDWTSFVRFARAEPGSVTWDFSPLTPAAAFPPRPASDQAAPQHPREAERRPPVDPPLRHLPSYLTPVIGRETVVEAILRRLASPTGRLVTLTGPGGVGKTRVAVEVGRRLAGAFADGICFVDLSPLTDPDLVLLTIARALGAREQGAQALQDSLQAALRGQQILLILDNFEQVLPAGRLVHALLQACPQVKALVTSRAGLRLRGELEFPIAPLPLPDDDLGPLPLDEGLAAPPDARFTVWRAEDRLFRSSPSDETIARIMRSPAVQLFVERALAVKPDFTLSHADALAVASLCRRLDGLPLAIELAATRVRLMPLHTMLKRLEPRLGFLTGGPRDLPERQQTLRQTIAWSYDLLDEAHQAVFRRLAVFNGGFTLEAAESVVNTPAEAAAILDDLETLAIHSLLTPTEVLGQSRFRLLDTIREYAWEQLTASEEAETIKQRHGAYYLAVAENTEPHLGGGEQVAWLDHLEVEHDNLRAALRWASQTGSGEIELRLATALYWFWYLRGYLSEGRAWLESALQRVEAAHRDDVSAPALPLLRAMALNRAGILAYAQGDFAVARARVEASLALHRQLEDQGGIARCMNNLGMIAYEQGDYAAARALYQQCTAIWQALGDRRYLSSALGNLGETVRHQGDYAMARALFEESLVIKRELGDQWAVAGLLNNQGELALDEGDQRAAQRLFELSLTKRRELGDRMGIARELNNLGRVATLEGRLDEAQSLLDQSLATRRELGDLRGAARSLHDLGCLASAKRDYARAGSLLLESLTLRQALGDRLGLAEGLEALAELAHHHAVAQPQRQAGMEQVVRLLGAAAALRAATETPLPTGQLTAHRRVLTAAQARLRPMAFDQAWSEGQAMSVSQVIGHVRLEEGA